MSLFNVTVNLFNEMLTYLMLMLISLNFHLSLHLCYIRYSSLVFTNHYESEVIIVFGLGSENILGLSCWLLYIQNNQQQTTTEDMSA